MYRSVTKAIRQDVMSRDAFWNFYTLFGRPSFGDSVGSVRIQDGTPDVLIAMIVVMVAGAGPEAESGDRRASSPLIISDAPYDVCCLRNSHSIGRFRIWFEIGCVRADSRSIPDQITNTARHESRK